MGFSTVPYERAMLRVWERAEDNVAPRVPDDNANAPEKKKKERACVFVGVVLGERDNILVTGWTHRMCSSPD